MAYIRNLISIISPENMTQRDFKNYKQVLNDMMNNYYFPDHGARSECR